MTFSLIMGILILHITLLLLTIPGNAVPQEKRSWQLELLPGIAVVPPMSLTIHQSNHPDLYYQTKSLQLPPYYSNQFSTSKHNEDWSLEMNHLKIYHKNIPSDLEHYCIPHSHHQFCLNRDYVKDHIPMNKGRTLEPIIAFLLLTNIIGKS
ncbi:MAG: hypothetical protein JEZ14_18230 [Marinilabiliaceae bacterium]|nr:hypothetical protein [Marinilabiliaceae bacterium]